MPEKPRKIPPLAITMGEPAGIGTEITLKAYQYYKDQLTSGGPCFFLIDDPARVSLVKRELNADLSISSISTPEEALSAFDSGLPVLPLTDLPSDIRNSPGTPVLETASNVISSIKHAVQFAKSGQVAGIVTNPIQKEILLQSGFEFPGHTEYLGALTADIAMPAGLARGPVMMLTSSQLRVVPATIHIPLADVPSKLTTELLLQVASVTAQAMVRDFGVDDPRLALCGLNPHAGESGKIGKEDIEIIAPAVQHLQQAGMKAAGPFPADTIFHSEARAQYHAAIAMYHDQGLIPIKTIDFYGAVNVTLGLPIVRTSPDHGTGLALAGKGIARPDSMIQAILTAHNMYASRQVFDAQSIVPAS